MKTKRWLAVMVVSALLSGAAQAQYTADRPIFPPPAPMARDGVPPQPAGYIASSGGGLSDWIVYRRECCEGQAGIDTPLYTEIFLNAGPSFPVGGSTLARELQTGWSIMGGMRALFFDEPHTRAWTFDVHVINTCQSGGRLNTQFPITFFQNGVRSDNVVFNGVAGRKTFSIQNSNRTLAGFGGGRTWYLWHPADGDGSMCRIGVDGGGRYGSGRANFNEFGHTVDVIGSMYAGVHSAVEVPWHSFLFHAGLRFEWAYTWSDVLQRTSDTQDLSLFLTFGIRY